MEHEPAARCIQRLRLRLQPVRHSHPQLKCLRPRRFPCHVGWQLAVKRAPASKQNLVCRLQAADLGEGFLANSQTLAICQRAHFHPALGTFRMLACRICVTNNGAVLRKGSRAAKGIRVRYGQGGPKHPLQVLPHREFLLGSRTTWTSMTLGTSQRARSILFSWQHSTRIRQSETGQHWV